MGKKMRGGRGSSSASVDRILFRRIESSKSKIPSFSYSDVETVTNYLRDQFPDYARIKFQPLNRCVGQALNTLRLRQTPQKMDTERREREQEERLQLAEADHLRSKRRREESSSLDSTSASGSSFSSEDEDAVFDAKVDPNFDVTKVILREKYRKLAAASLEEGRNVVEIENSVKSKPKSVMLVSRIARDIDKTSPVVERVMDGGFEDSEKGKGSEGPRFKDFGGIQDVLEDLIMEVVIPLCYPQLPSRLGVRPMSGILLHGPPGCGKTRLAHAIANETGLPFYKISGPEVVSGISGESEGNIRTLFNKAYRTAPSIVFIDEIDAIASKRENMQKEMERRIVTQLMTCMDESHQTLSVSSTSESGKTPGYVLVIGATNRPDSVDHSLRRPGRFDREISLGVPDENARRAILSLLITNLTVDGDIDLHKIARSTFGFVGADLKALVNKAGNLAIKRIIDRRKIELSEKTLGNDENGGWWRCLWVPEEMENLNITITMGDFEEATKLIQPSLKREGFSSIPKVKWGDIGGLGPIRETFDLYIVQHIKDPEGFEELGVTSKTGFLLYGPPGCGKTLIAKAVANEAGASFIHIKGPELLNKYVGESESKVREIFSNARTCSPCIIFIDEIDGLTKKRGKDGEHVHESLLTQLLVELDGADERRGVYVIGATNRIEIVDPAIRRPGRLGNVLFVPLPSAEERVLILKTLARTRPLAHDVDLDIIGRSNACQNFSGADLNEVMERAGAIAYKEKMLSIRQDCTNHEPSVIKASHFEEALRKVVPSVQEKEMQRYERLWRKGDLIDSTTFQKEMEEAKGIVKHVLLAKFKDDVTPLEIEDLIKGYDNLVTLIEPMKAFHWGKDVSIENMHQGFTHFFESTFQSSEGIAEYIAHPAHVEFANKFLSSLEKVIVFDYKPTTVAKTK